MEHAAAVRALAALGETHRLAIFRLLVVAGPSGMAAGEIARAAGISATGLSFHIKELERAGLVRCWRDGRFVRSAVVVERMRGLLAFLAEDCCQGRPELCGADFAAATRSDRCCPAETTLSFPTSGRTSDE